MKEIFTNLTNFVLDSFEMSLYTNIANQEYQDYYMMPSSKEHYRLLSYLSTLFEDTKFVDVGTLKGCSALALSTNYSNRVYSFNVSNQLQLKSIPKNIDFIIDNVISGNYDTILLDSKLILLDTFHDGVFEKQFLDYLINLGYKGILLLDDIHLNNEMHNFWESITLEKQDITKLGHVTGTGVVFFE
jgi:hypothetical protein